MSIILLSIIGLYILTQLVPELYTALDLICRTVIFLIGLPFVIAYAFYKTV